MEEITIKLTDETVRRVNETLCEERRHYSSEKDFIAMAIGHDSAMHDDELTYWAKN